MRTSLTLRALAGAAVLVFVVSACGSDDSSSGSSDTKATSSTTAMKAEEGTQATGTIVDVAAGNPDFSTLVSAVKKADLVSTLSGSGPFTVFAPTNDAFAKVPTD